MCAKAFRMFFLELLSDSLNFTDARLTMAVGTGNAQAQANDFVAEPQREGHYTTIDGHYTTMDNYNNSVAHRRFRHYIDRTIRIFKDFLFAPGSHSANLHVKIFEGQKKGNIFKIFTDSLAPWEAA